MSTSANMKDMAYYTQMFKGNYVKGINNLRAILNIPEIAEEFINNYGALAVVYSGAEKGGNSSLLLNVISKSPYEERAALKWVEYLGFTTHTNWHDIANDSESMANIANSATAMTAVAASPTAMAAVVESETAVAAIYKNPVALVTLQVHSEAYALFINCDSAVMAKAVCLLGGLNPDDFSDMSALAASANAMNILTLSPTATNALALSQTAMTAVAASPTAMQALYGNAEITESILMKSNVAINAFTALSKNYSQKSSTWGTGESKPAFILTMMTDYGTIANYRERSQCGSYKMGAARRQSDVITPNVEVPMYGFVSIVEAVSASGSYTTTVRYFTW